MTETIEYIVTKHAQVRIKERLGIKPSAVNRQFKLAVERNVLGKKELPSFVMNWIKGATKLRNDIPYKKEITIYNKHAFVYSINGIIYTLITVLETPAEFEKYL